jgi:macrocin-O-methyltransferase TylF-like protien
LAIEYLADRLGLDRQRSFFFRALEYQHRIAAESRPPTGTYYEFGVGWGGTLTKYLSAQRSFCRTFRMDPRSFRAYAFDTFAGLPPSADVRDRHPAWGPGEFAHSRAEISARLRSRGLPSEPPALTMFEGVFDVTLTAALQRELAAHPPAIVTVDVDYYTSTRTVLHWLRPILTGGAIFYFDDIWSFHGDPEMGELAAIREFNRVGPGTLTSFPILGMPSHAYIYSGPAATPSTPV